MSIPLLFIPVCTEPAMAIRNNGNETQSPGCLQVLVLKRVAGPLLYPNDQADEQVLALFGEKKGGLRFHRKPLAHKGMWGKLAREV